MVAAAEHFLLLMATKGENKIAYQMRDAVFLPPFQISSDSLNRAAVVVEEQL
jgi:hypothetical protein